MAANFQKKKSVLNMTKKTPKKCKGAYNGGKYLKVISVVSIAANFPWKKSVFTMSANFPKKKK